MSVPPLQTLDITSNSPVAAYLNASTAVCPFIEPAVRADSLLGCTVSPDCQISADIHPRLFEQMVPIIERFRTDRRAIPEKSQRLLLCHVAVIHFQPHLDADAVRLLAWPNWLGLLLKQLYTPKEIVFGFVRKNVAEKSLFGGLTPAAPFHAIIIRSRIVTADHRFFPDSPQLLQAMMQAEDDGQNAHASVSENLPDLSNPESIRDANYFERVRQWGQMLLTRK
jgi:hypothetical protein